MYWKLKLKAILHDPPYKMLAFQGPSQLVQNIKLQKAPHKNSNDHYLHEIWAEELLNCIFANECIKDNNVELADQLASAQSRIIVKPQLQNEQDFNKDSQVNYNESYFIDIFSERKEPIQTPDEEEVQDLFNKLGGLFPSSSDEEVNNQKAKFIFLFLWRFYPEIFPQINKHPADSRAPNHSIYDHLVQT
ncbi:MAG: hypothetical protein ACO2O6_06085, partial [Candidatus Hydrothermia bacterium]